MIQLTLTVSPVESRTGLSLQVSDRLNNDAYLVVVVKMVTSKFQFKSTQILEYLNRVFFTVDFITGLGKFETKILLKI